MSRTLGGVPDARETADMERGADVDADSEALAADALASLENMQQGSYPFREPFASVFKSVPLLVYEKQRDVGLDTFRGAIRSVKTVGSERLISRIHTTVEPLMLWAIHLELDKRGIAPCFRWPANDDTDQAEFITWLADVYWFHKRHPLHKASFRGWIDLMAQPPASKKWHQHAVRQYSEAYKRGAVSYYSSTGLGLTDAHRQDLMMMPTKAMVASRRAIKGAAFDSIFDALYTYATTHPDRAGVHTADRVAKRRVFLFRTHTLAGRSATKTAQYWTLITGEKLSRQAVTAQVERIELILGR